MARRVGITKATMRRAERAERAASKRVGKGATTDSFQNFAAQLGIGTSNLSSFAGYGFNPVTRNHTELEWAYRGTWLLRTAVDAIADDMTKAGIEIESQMPPGDIDRLMTAMRQLMIWQRINETLKWGRLYGGAIAVFLIDGQKPDTPLRLETIGRKQLKGMIVLDRWMVEPSLQDLVTDQSSADLGLPKFYNVTADAPALPRMKIHHSRCLRFIGDPLPYWQTIAENMWGASIMEAIFDRITAFDSASTGAAQLMFKAHLRTLKMENLRALVAAGGPAAAALRTTIEFMRQTQSSEGISVIDSKDELQFDTYTFGGISDVILQFGQQLSGALQIPLVRLFGQSPAGLNSTGESDMRNYYDGINKRQESDLRRPLELALRVVAKSEAIEVPADFAFIFRPLWLLSPEQKGQIAQTSTASITQAFEAGVVDVGIAMKELRQMSKTTGVFSNITDEDIEKAVLNPPVPGAEEDPGAEPAAVDPAAASPGGPGRKPTAFHVHVPESHAHLVEGAHAVVRQGASAIGQTAHVPGELRRSLRVVDSAIQAELTHLGLPIVIEAKAGDRRGDGDGVDLPAHYGYIRHTQSAEGPGSEMDCFVHPDWLNTPTRQRVFVIDGYIDGKFDEHKVMLGYESAGEALAHFAKAYPQRTAGGSKQMTVDELKAWLKDADLSKPIAPRPSLRALRA